MVGKQKNPFQGSFAVDQDGSNLLGLQSCPEVVQYDCRVDCIHFCGQADLWKRLTVASVGRFCYTNVRIALTIESVFQQTISFALICR